MREVYLHFGRPTSGAGTIIRDRRAGTTAARAAALLALLFAAPLCAAFTLTILHTNDLHSRLQAVNDFNATCAAKADAAGQCFGGVARVIGLIERRRREIEKTGGALLVLDAGDQFQGSLFYTTYKGEAAARFMNTVGYDVMTVGNHEFDDGPDNLARFLDMVAFPVVSANIDASNSRALAGRIAPYAVIQRGKERIGIVGAIAEDTAEISSPGPEIVFNEVETALAGAVEALQALGIDKIVALTHIGLGRDRIVAGRVRGIDVIVGGHSHTYLASDDPAAAGHYPVLVPGESGRPVPIVHAYAYSRVVGELKVVFDDDGNVVEWEGGPHILDASIAADADAGRRVRELAKPFEALMNRVVGATAAPVDADRCRRAECEMGNLVAEAMLARTRAQGVQAAIQNGGGLRASFDAGEVTMGEVLAVLPFQNTVATFDVSGAALVDALENGVSQADSGAGRFPQVAGIRYTWNPRGTPGDRIRTVEMQTGGAWRPVEPSGRYLVATNDYLRRGGDGYTMFRDRAVNAYDFGPGLEEVLADYLTARPSYSPVLDGRIRAVTQ